MSLSDDARRLLILHDSPQFGGHEIIFFRMLPALLDSGRFSEITFCYPAENRKLSGRLADFAAPCLALRPWPFVKRRAEPYLADFRLRYRNEVRRIVQQTRPDAVLLLQGRIENLAVPMISLSRSARIVSYIPMAQKLTDMGRSSPIGDKVRERLYARPDRFIVPSSAVAAQVRQAGGRAPCTVVENVVNPPPMVERREARRRCGLPEDHRIALFLGRLDTAQKGVDLLADAIKRSAKSSSAWTYVFAGEGPGRTIVQALQSELSGRVEIRDIGWTDQPHLYLSAVDALLIPSRWEGVPLVMLEAMTYGLPILASQIDVFHDYLPEESRVDFTTVDLGQALDGLTGSDRAAATSAYASRLQGVDLATSSQRFLSALVD